MAGDQLLFHNLEIGSMTAIVWIGSAYSPIWAPTILVNKQDDEGRLVGMRPMRMAIDLPSSECINNSARFPVDRSRDYIEVPVRSFISSFFINLEPASHPSSPYG